MGVENQHYFQNEWDASLQRSLEKLKHVPAALLFDGSISEVLNKKGEKISLASKYYYFRGKDIQPCEPPGEGMRHYLLARDEKNEIVGTRISSIFRERNRLVARSKIMVKDRGQGMASVVEESFITALQHLANSEQQKVVWEVYNENADTLERQEKMDVLDDETLRQLREEQKRWQHLYGEGGKYKIHKGKRVFEPSPSAT